jgi:hypothetical protein
MKGVLGEDMVEYPNVWGAAGNSNQNRNLSDKNALNKRRKLPSRFGLIPRRML